MNKQNLKQILEKYIEEKKTVWEIMELLSCSKNTVINNLKKHDIATPKGFFSKGKKVGRPKGIPMSETQKSQLSFRFMGKGNPMYGKTHTEETKNLMSENHPDVSGDNNPFKKSLEDPKKLQAHRDRSKAMWESRDEKYRKEISRKISKSLSESDATRHLNFNRNHKSGFMGTKKAGTVFYRSSWEEFVCIELDKSSLVKSFELEAFSIPYFNINGDERFVNIDFYVELTNNERIIIEVKPMELCKFKNNPYKIVGYKEYCKENNIQFILATENYISEKAFNETLEKCYEGGYYVKE